VVTLTFNGLDSGSMVATDVLGTPRLFLLAALGLIGFFLSLGWMVVSWPFVTTGLAFIFLAPGGPTITVLVGLFLSFGE
jgi:hypothetical protein